MVFGKKQVNRKVPKIETFIFPVYVYYNMKTVYSLRIDKELREEMEKYNVKWNEEIENFIRRRIEELKKEEIFKKINEILQTMPETKSNSAELVREDRDNN